MTAATIRASAAYRKRQAIARRQLALLTDVDWLTEVIADSLDEGWCSGDGARAIVRRAKAEAQKKEII